MIGKERIRAGVSLSFLLLLAIFVLLPAGVSAASFEEVKSVARVAPASFGADEEVEIVLNIGGEAPLAVGIVETIPEGFRFPEKDSDVSDAAHFEVDREAGMIAFSVLDETEIRYRVIASPAGGKDSFTGKWVDLLVQTPELNEGKERWESVSDPNSILPASGSKSQTGSSTASDSSKAGSEESGSSAPGFGIGIAFPGLLICASLFKMKISGGREIGGGRKIAGGRK